MLIVASSAAAGRNELRGGLVLVSGNPIETLASATPFQVTTIGIGIAGRHVLRRQDLGAFVDVANVGAFSSMPAASSEDVPEFIKKYENPESPDALPGAISLARRDCIHVLPGRGLHVQGEAFIVGATIGTASDITGEIVEFFIKVSTAERRQHWRFKEEHIPSFRLGVGFAMGIMRGSNWQLIALENEPWQSKTVRDAQKARHRQRRATRIFQKSGSVGAGDTGCAPTG